MRIACVDRTATDRLRLEELLGDGFRECRKTIGHLLVAKFYPCSKEEALINKPPDILIIGPELSSDEAFSFAREWNALYPVIPIFLFSSEENYSLKNLKRLESYVRDVFCLTDKASRFVFSITSVRDLREDCSKGCLVTVQGVKGGVGVTSIVGGLAHAYQELGKSVVVVDLSRHGIFSQFMLSDKWQSSELSEALAQKVIPDADQIDRFLITLKNGIQVLLPPSGSGDIRECYVRNSDLLETPLFIIDRLLEKYDVVLVDTAGTEGILPFALSCRADCRIVISSNDTGSIHLLGSILADIQAIGEGRSLFVLNRLVQTGLNFEDVLDYISWVPSFDESILFSEEVPFDSRAALWVGTGNSIYTEGTRKLKSCLCALANCSLGASRAVIDDVVRPRKFLGLLPSLNKNNVPIKAKANLPLLRLEENDSNSSGDLLDFSYAPPRKVVNQ